MTSTPAAGSQLSFTAFILSLATTAAVHFGDIPDPATGRPAAPNLQGAAQMIDILLLLDQKTRGNLTAEERQLLEQVLHELRVRFVRAAAEAGIHDGRSAGTASGPAGSTGAANSTGPPSPDGPTGAASPSGSPPSARKASSD